MDRTILFVDDDPKIRDLMRATLEFDFSLLEAESGEKALQTLKESTPDLILLDIMMPGIDGFEVCRRIKSGSGTSNIPVIMLTGRGDNEDKEGGKQAGADSYFTKPFSPKALLDKVNEFLG